jgi:hypothetical protein
MACATEPPLPQTSLAEDEEAPEIQPLAATGVEGLWSKCYEPGLQNVVEIDHGYLLLMPDLHYAELSESCCYTGFPGEPSGPTWNLNRYRVEGETVVLSAATLRGEAYEIRLLQRSDVAAVFHDAPEGAPVVTEALTHDGDLDYGWCKVYPERNTDRRPE